VQFTITEEDIVKYSPGLDSRVSVIYRPTVGSYMFMQTAMDYLTVWDAVNVLAHTAPVAWVRSATEKALTGFPSYTCRVPGWKTLIATAIGQKHPDRLRELARKVSCFDSQSPEPLRFDKHNATYGTDLAPVFARRVVWALSLPARDALAHIAQVAVFANSAAITYSALDTSRPDTIWQQRVRGFSRLFMRRLAWIGTPPHSWE